MSGAYAHITLVKRAIDRRDDWDGIPNELWQEYNNYYRFCELGAVSPDYPYLVLGNLQANVWADYMHGEKAERSLGVIRRGARRLRNLAGESRGKGLAWLLGYSAHVVMDTTFHPVINLKVGPYRRNKTKHRVCEMHQDTYIWQDLNLGNIGLSEYLESGIGRCSAPRSGGGLDRNLSQLWAELLEEVYHEYFPPHRPDLDQWHRSFMFVVGKIASGGQRMLPLGRHVLFKKGLIYPRLDELDHQYIENLPTPGGGTATYREIFDRTLENLGRMWTAIGQAVYAANDAPLGGLGEWNLGTGKNHNKAYVYWS